MCNKFFAAYHYGYVQQYNLYNQYGYHQQALPQVAHPRTGSNLSSGSSNNGGPLGGHHQQQHHGHHNKHSSRPKSNYYEYEMYNNNPASYMSTASSAASSSNSHYPSNSDHPQLPPGQPHPTMYSLPRSSSGYWSIFIKSEQVWTNLNRFEQVWTILDIGGLLSSNIVIIRQAVITLHCHQIILYSLPWSIVLAIEEQKKFTCATYIFVFSKTKWPLNQFYYQWTKKCHIRN